MIHIKNGILLSYKKEHIWVSSNEVDEMSLLYSMKSERETFSEREILYINNIYGI